MMRGTTGNQTLTTKTGTRMRTIDMTRAWQSLLMGVVAMLGCADDPPLYQLGVGPRVVVRSEPASAEQCPEGGSVISAGIDLNTNGVLDDDEIETRQVACYGPAPSPPAALVGLVAEPAGKHCSTGGTAVQTGLDLDGNGHLDPSEVIDVEYLCGEVLLTRLAQEPPGSRCAAGGVAILAGRDHDGDDVLGDDEVELREVECGDVLTRDVEIHSSADVAALAGVRVLTGTLTVTSLDVETLALPALQYLDGSLVLGFHGALHVLALPSLERVTGELTLEGELTAIELPRLQRVGRLHLQFLDGLSDLRGFPALTQVDDAIVIFETSLASVELSLAALGGGLVIQANPQLAKLTCTLTDHVGAVEILDNAQLEDLVITVTGTHQRPALGSTTIRFNPQLERIALSADSALDVEVGSNPRLVQVSMTVARVERTLLVSCGSVPCTLALDSPGPGDIAFGHDLVLAGPMQALQTTRRVVVDGVAELFHTRLVSLDNVAVARGGLLVTENPLLVRVGPMEVGTSLELVGNTALLSLSPLSFVGDLAWLSITRNPALIDASALSEVRRAEHIIVLQNQALEHLPLLHLEQVHRLDVFENPAIQTIEMPALVTAEFQIEVRGNPQLRHVDLRSLIRAALVFFSNPRLPTCELLALFAHVEGPVQQGDNDDDATCVD